MDPIDHSTSFLKVELDPDSAVGTEQGQEQGQISA